MKKWEAEEVEWLINEYLSEGTYLGDVPNMSENSFLGNALSIVRSLLAQLKEARHEAAREYPPHCNFLK